jgi:exopolysaccharide production protein ExoZ
MICVLSAPWRTDAETPRIYETATLTEMRNDRERRAELMTVQSLRAVAALMVVAYHAANQWGTHLSPEVEIVWANGSGGVDIFFVISGLVMVLSAQRCARLERGWWLFLHQRLTRIVPMYWIMTTVKIGAVAVLPIVALHTRFDVPYLLGSYFFIPVPDETGHNFPILSVGWTLCYEMLFYVLVCVALAARVSLFCVVLPVLGAFAVAALFHAFEFANTIALEFILGMTIGARLRRLEQLPTLPMTIVFIAAWLVLLVIPVGSGELRPLTWGLPAALIVASAVALEKSTRSRLPAWLLTLGEASYAIYLTHVFVVPMIYGVIARLHLLGGAGLLIAVVIAGLAGSSMVGVVVYSWLESPILAWLRHYKPVPVLASRIAS